MKTKSFSENYASEIETKLQELIDAGEVNEVISFALTSHYVAGAYGGTRHTAILIYK